MPFKTVLRSYSVGVWPFSRVRTATWRFLKSKNLVFPDWPILITNYFFGSVIDTSLLSNPSAVISDVIVYLSPYIFFNNYSEINM